MILLQFCFMYIMYRTYRGMSVMSGWSKPMGFMEPSLSTSACFCIIMWHRGHCRMPQRSKACHEMSGGWREYQVVPVTGDQYQVTWTVSLDLAKLGMVQVVRAIRIAWSHVNSYHNTLIHLVSSVVSNPKLNSMLGQASCVRGDAGGDVVSFLARNMQTVMQRIARLQWFQHALSVWSTVYFLTHTHTHTQHPCHSMPMAIRDAHKIKFEARDRAGLFFGNAKYQLCVAKIYKSLR